jgi:hypothetical protein
MRRHLGKEHHPMSATPHTTPSRRHGLDWVVFAALMIALAGVFNVVDGLVALVDSRFYAAGAVYVWSDVRTWG